MIKVSIIIPVYNTEKYIEKFINSLINQTYKNIEIICVNDGSTDKSLELLKKFKNKDNRIKIINQENQGGIIARKNGILAATGQYIMILDSDDWVDTNLVNDMVKIVEENPFLDIIKFGFITEPNKIECYPLKNPIKNVLYNKKNIDELINYLIYNVNFNNIWNQFIKRELFDFDSWIYNKIVHKGEDLQINLQLYTKAENILVLNKCYYHYRYNPIGITNNIEIEKIINNIYDNIYLNNIRSKIALEKFNKCDYEVLKNNTLNLVNGKIVALLIRSKQLDNDLKKLQNALDDKFYSYIGNFTYKDISAKNILYKIMINNILKRKIIKSKKYKVILKTIYKIRKNK